MINTSKYRIKDVDSAIEVIKANKLKYDVTCSDEVVPVYLYDRYQDKYIFSNPSNTLNIILVIIRNAESLNELCVLFSSTEREMTRILMRLHKVVSNEDIMRRLKLSDKMFICNSIINMLDKEN